MTTIRIYRTHRFSRSIGGELRVDDEFVCYTLELPWRWNKKNVSCIPAGTYDCYWRYDRQRFQLEDIPCDEGYRVAIQIHSGNKPEDSKGCILVGCKLSANLVLRSKDAVRLLEKAVWKGEYGPGYGRKAIVLKIGGVLMDSRYDELEKLPVPRDFAVA